MPATNVREELVGMSAERAAALTGISTRRLKSWHQIGLVSPRVDAQLSPRTVVRLYGFDQLVELLVAHDIVQRGHSVRQVRSFVDVLRADHPKPLRQLRWAVEGDELFVQFPDGTWYGDRRPTQSVLAETIDLDEVRARVHEGLVRPGRPGDVERRRGAMGGKPVFAGTRTPVAAVRTYLARGASDREILEAFPHLTKADIQTARDWEAA
jgi:uncharacterized protein (DUF433 family)